MFCVKGAEKQHSMCLVCVPLDVEDTLGCYQQALERRPHCLQAFQHSRTLLLLHLAYTQPCESSSDYVDTHLHSYIVAFLFVLQTHKVCTACVSTQAMGHSLGTVRAEVNILQVWWISVTQLCPLQTSNLAPWQRRTSLVQMLSTVSPSALTT